MKHLILTIENMTDSEMWYNIHCADSKIAHFGMYMNMVCVAFCLKNFASNVTGLWSFAFWVLVFMINGFGIYWGRCTINNIEKCKLNLIMDNL